MTSLTERQPTPSHPGLDAPGEALVLVHPEGMYQLRPGAEWIFYGRRLVAALQVAWPEALRRALDVVVASVGLALTLPLTLPLLLGRALSLKPLVMKVAVLGQGDVPFNALAFHPPGGPVGRWMVKWGIFKAPLLLNLLFGDVTLVGPRPHAVGALDRRSPLVRWRQAVKPGLLCTYWLQQRSNTDFKGELAADRQYLEQQSLREDLRILLSAALVFFYGAPAAQHTEEVEVFGVRMANLTLDGAVEAVVSRMEGEGKRHIAYLNAHNANVAYTDESYKATLQACDLVLPDGIGLKLAGSLLGTPIRQNVNGTDLFPALCERLSGTGHRVYLLGGAEGVAAGVVAWMAEHHPGVEVCGFHHGYVKDPAANEEALADLRAARPTLLLVAMGTPDQEKWIDAHLDAIPVKVAMGVGGLFDFYSGLKPRAPIFLREAGLEWVYRLVNEPGRLWRRYVVGNPVFLLRVMWDALRARGDSRGGSSAPR